MGIHFQIVQRGLLKKPHVEFSCPTCNTTLHAPLDDAGESDTCPECGTPFVTPGAEALQAQQESEQAAADRRAAERDRELEARAKAISREADARLERSLAGQRRSRDAERSTNRPSSWLGAVGWLLLILGLVGCVVGAFMDTTVPLTTAMTGLRFPDNPGEARYHNEGLMLSRLLIVGTGSLSLLFGLVLVGLDIGLAELDRIRRLLERPADSAKLQTARREHVELPAQAVP